MGVPGLHNVLHRIFTIKASGDIEEEYSVEMILANLGPEKMGGREIHLITFAMTHPNFFGFQMRHIYDFLRTIKEKEVGPIGTSCQLMVIICMDKIRDSRDRGEVGKKLVRSYQRWKRMFSELSQ